MNNAVTIIVGAGAVLDFEHKGIFPSVKNITDQVLKLSIQKVDGGERPLLREINDYIVGKLNQVGRSEVNRYIPPQLIFESLLHVIEMCISYSSCWHKEYISWLALPEFGSLIQSDDFLKDIQAYDYIRAAYGLQKTVMNYRILYLSQYVVYLRLLFLRDDFIIITVKCLLIDGVVVGEACQERFVAIIFLDLPQQHCNIITSQGFYASG